MWIHSFYFSNFFLSYFQNNSSSPVSSHHSVSIEQLELLIHLLPFHALTWTHRVALITSRCVCTKFPLSYLDTEMNES